MRLEVRTFRRFLVSFTKYISKNTLPITYWGVDLNVVRQTIIKKTREWGLSDCLLPKLFPSSLTNGNTTNNNLSADTLIQNDLNNMSTYALMQNDQSNTINDENNQNDKKDIPMWQQHLLDYDRNLIGEVTKSLLLKSLHEVQPWYHGRLTRLEAEKHLLDSGHKDGKFLIDALTSGTEFAIQDGHKFSSLLALISHYSVFCDGLYTLLTDPCPRRNNTNILNDLNSVRNLNLLNRALSRANIDLYPNNYNLQPLNLTGNSTSSSSSCSSSGSTNMSTTNRLNHSSKAKIKDWLININQKWSQLLSSMQCRPNGAHQLMHDCDSIKYGIVQYSKTQDPMQMNMYNYQLYSAAVRAATHAVEAAKQQMINGKCNLNNLNGLNSMDCGHPICESLYSQYGQTKSNLINNNQMNLNSQTNLSSSNKNEQDNSCQFNTSTFSLPQNSIINDCSTNFRSLVDLNTPLIYLDYNKEAQNSLNFRSLNCETNTRQLYGLLTGTGSVGANKNAGRPWSNTATLAPKRVTNKVQPIPINNLNNNNQLNSNQLNGNLINNTSNNTSNNLISLSTNNASNNQNQLNSQRNKANTNSNKGQTLPTIYESNHYKETDLQPLFNSFSNDKHAPPIPSSNPPSKTSNRINSFNVSSSSNYHHQPSAVLKQLPINNELKTDKTESKINPSNDEKEDDNKKENNDNEINKKQDNKIDNKISKQDKQLKMVNLNSNKYEEEITIYQRPVPLPGRLIKSSSLEDLFKIKVCKLNPLCSNGDPLEQTKRIIFCANPGPLTKIKNTNVSTNIDQFKQPTINKDNDEIINNSTNKPINENNSNDITDDNLDKDQNNSNKEENVNTNDKNVDNDNNQNNNDDGNNLENSNSQIIDNKLNDHNNQIENKDEDKNSLNTALSTAIAASFKGFLGDLKACKQNQLALSTFRPLSNTVQQSTGITGTLNTSSLPITQQSIKTDPSIEQINTMANPFTFKNNTKNLINNQNGSQSNQSNNSTQFDQEQQNNKLNKTDITDLLKEFDVCFGEEDANDLISFSNDNNDQIGSYFANLPPPPPSMLQNTTVNSCPTSNFLQSSSNCSSSNLNCLSTSSLNSNNTISNNSSKLISSIEEPNHIIPSNCSSNESLQQNESSLAKLLDQNEHFKQASLGPATLETYGSEIQLSELDLICFEEDPEKVKDTLRKYKQSPLSLDPNFISLKEKVGNGFFGEVFLGEISAKNHPNPQISNNFNSVPPLKVAVKVLKCQSSMPNHKMDILKEAQTMASLDHKHIVRLIGVCESNPLMLIMEYCAIGPLNRYLQENQSRVPLDHILLLMRQVALAMRYLESKMYIHRDLAARNVLLVNEHFVKISDFGMSRALGIGKEYYKARNSSKKIWPLRWYAPECIYYFKFSSKSDVWSFGIVLWESVSFGKKPYEGMDGQKILKLFRENKRLAKPVNCPDDIYELMWSCWLEKWK